MKKITITLTEEELELIQYIIWCCTDKDYFEELEKCINHEGLQFYGELISFNEIDEIWSKIINQRYEQIIKKL